MNIFFYFKQMLNCTFLLFIFFNAMIEYFVHSKISSSSSNPFYCYHNKKKTVKFFTWFHFTNNFHSSFCWRNWKSKRQRQKTHAKMNMNICVLLEKVECRLLLLLLFKKGNCTVIKIFNVIFPRFAYLNWNKCIPSGLTGLDNFIVISIQYCTWSYNQVFLHRFYYVVCAGVK